MRETLPDLSRQMRNCRLCCDRLPLRPRPVFQIDQRARILIAGQAPGSRVHASGVPFDDASGDRLRGWMGITRGEFYDPEKFAILPMALCYPGAGASGDLGPLALCARTWRQRALDQLKAIRLTLVIGRYALKWHLPEVGDNLTLAVQSWKDCGEALIPLPHPSPRNNRWLKRNRWFYSELIPELRDRVAAVLS